MDGLHTPHRGCEGSRCRQAAASIYVVEVASTVGAFENLFIFTLLHPVHSVAEFFVIYLSSF